MSITTYANLELKWYENIKSIECKTNFWDYSCSKKIGQDLLVLKFKTTEVSNQDLRNLAECDK